MCCSVTRQASAEMSTGFVTTFIKKGPVCNIYRDLREKIKYNTYSVESIYMYIRSGSSSTESAVFLQ